VRLQLTSQGVGELRYDADGDGTYETIVAPTSAVSGLAANDLTPPTLTIQATPETGGRRVTIDAQDASGVGAVYYSLDGATFQPYTGPISGVPLQLTTLYAFADDRVGNRSPLLAYAVTTSSSPSPSPSPSPSASPSPSPSASPSPTPSIAPIPSPSLTPSPS